MSQDTSILIRNAILSGRAVKTSMEGIAASTSLVWSQIYRAIEVSRAAREPVGFLLQAAADPAQSVRNIETEFSKEIGKSFTIQEIQTIFITIMGQGETVGQGELYNNAAFVLFDAQNTLERVLIDPNNLIQIALCKKKRLQALILIQSKPMPALS